MSRAVVTAILLEDLIREDQEIRLPADALLTPSARDWLKEHPVPVTWETDAAGCGQLAAVMDPSLEEMRLIRRMLDRRGELTEVIELNPGRSGTLAATREVCGKIMDGQVARGVLFVQDAALPVCVANKHKGIRAAMGLSVPMVEDVCREVGINVLVLEYPTLTTYQMKQMIDRLLAGPASPPSEACTTIRTIETEGR